MDKHPFFIGQWQANPQTNSLRLGNAVKQLEPKAMDVLLLLCQRKGEVLSADSIADACWGNADIGDNPVHKAITQLRKALGDKASTPIYIETIRKRGYQIIADVSFPLDNTQNVDEATWQNGSPFPGLSAFESKEATVFFGRNEQIATLLKRISNQVAYKRAFTLLLGASGTGKSSLINAGVLPKLIDPKGYDGIRVISHVSIDFADMKQDWLLLDIASALLDWEVNDTPVFDGMSTEQLSKDLAQNVDAVIAKCQQACAKKETNENQEASPYLSVFFDRLEILLSSPNIKVNECDALLSIIEALARSGAVIVFSACRNDFYPQVVSHASLMMGKSHGSHFDLTSPTHADLSQMIRLPALAAGLSWTKDQKSGLSLDEILATEAANNPDSLPMLQYTLQELYLQRSSENALQISVFKTLGGIEGAIGKKAEEIHQQMEQSHQQELAYVLSLLVTVNIQDDSITSRTARWSQLSTQNQRDFVHAMVDSRLFISHLLNGEPCFRVAHEALLRRWPRATQWITEHRESIVIKGQLQEQSSRWLNEHKSKAYLLSKGKPLQQALSLQSNSAFTLEKQELAFIQASKAHANQRRWGKHAIVSLLCLLTFTAVLMSYKSQQSEYLAQQKRLEAESLLGFMVGEFADKLRSVKRMDLLDGISNKAIEYFSNNENNEQGFTLPFGKQARGFNERFQHAQTLGAMGEVAYSRSKANEAATAFSEAKKLLGNLYEEQPQNMELLKALGANAFWLGQLEYDASNFEAAEAFFLAYLEYSERMHALSPEDYDAIVELSDANSTLGSLYLEQQSYQKSKYSFEASLKYTNELLAYQPGDFYLKTDKADVLTWLAVVETHIGNISSSLQLHAQAQIDYEDLLATSPDEARILETLAHSYSLQADILRYKQEYRLSYDKITSSVKILTQIFEQDPNNSVWEADLLYQKVYEILLATNNETSDPLVTERELSELLGNESLWIKRNSRALISIISYYQQNNKWNNSYSLINDLSSKFGEHFALPPRRPLYINALAEFNLVKAKQFEYQNLKMEQIKECKAAIQLLSPLIEKSNNFEYLLTFVKAHSCLNESQKVSAEINILKKMSVADIYF